MFATDDFKYFFFFSLFQATMGPSMVKEVFGGTGSEIKTLITLAHIL